MTQLTDSVLEKIKKENIRPISKNKFKLKRFFLWFVIAAFFLLGALTAAVVMFSLVNQDWDIHEKIAANHLVFILMVLPYFWLIVLIIFLIIAYANYRKTRHSYRYRFTSVLLGVVLLVALIGFLVYQLDLGRRVEEIISDYLPYYRQINNNYQVWNKPESGLLAGSVTAVDQKILTIKDWNNQEWVIKLANGLEINSQVVKVGSKIKILGQLLSKSDHEFLADDIRLWCGCDACLKGKEGSCHQ